MLLCLVLGACGNDAPRSGPVTDEIAGLRSSVNQLTYPPYLRGEPASVGDLGYIARILADLGSTPARITDPSSRSYLLREARQFGPVSGRWLLLPFAADLPGYVRDVAAVRRQRSAQGWYADAANVPLGLRVETTTRALAVLVAARALKPSDVAASAPWLTRQASSPDPLVAATAADGLALLRRRVPAAATEVVPSSAESFRSLSQQDRSALLSLTEAYARLRSAAGRPFDVDVSPWRKVFDASVDQLPPADLYRLERVLVAGGVPVADLAAAVRRFRADQLPGGLYREPSDFAGDPQTTLYGQALRRLAGESTEDSELAHGSSGAAGPTDAGSRLVAEAVRVVASGSEGEASRFTVCRTIASLDPDTVAGWQLTSLACRLAGRSVAMPRESPWSTGSAQGTVAAARLVNALHDADLDLPDWIRAPEMSIHLDRPRTLGNTGNVAEVARAVRILGGGTADQDALVARAFDAARGCPGLPDLVRAVPGDPFSCDLATTLSVREWEESLS